MPEIDGIAVEGEWADAGYYEVRGGAQARAEDILGALYYGYDAAHFYIRADANRAWGELGEGVLGIYLGRSGAEPTIAYSRHGDVDSLIGYGAFALIEIHLDVSGGFSAALSTPGPLGKWGDPALSEALDVALRGSQMEVAIPFTLLGEPRPGDMFNVRIVWSEIDEMVGHDVQFVPADGPAQSILPDLTVIDYFLVVGDPANDDFGIGTYIYPLDAVFEPAVYDVNTFSAGVDGDEFVFRFDLNGPINNPWGSGINLSVQTFDVYVDFDPGAGTGARMLLEGRNAALAAEHGWDMAVWVEGWHQKVLVPDENGIPREVSGDTIRAIVDPNGSISLRVAASAVPTLGAVAEGDWGLDPTRFGFVAAVLSQEGFPSPGVRRVRDVEAEASQWRIGGGPEDSNHTRIMDLVFPDDQAAILSAYPPSQQPVGELGPDDFAQIPMLIVE